MSKVSTKVHMFGLAGVAAMCVVYSGCAKKVAAVTPPAPHAVVAQAAPPAAPVPAPSRAAVQTASTRSSNMPDSATRAQIQALLDRIQDVYFDYNKENLRPDALTALKADAHTLAEIIKQYPNFHLTVEGYCDDRGSEEYNLALGDERAKTAKTYLVMLGLPEKQLQTISYGKDRPVCTEETDACWQKNRRAHITQAS